LRSALRAGSCECVALITACSLSIRWLSCAWLPLSCFGPAKPSSRSSSHSKVTTFGRPTLQLTVRRPPTPSISQCRVYDAPAVYGRVSQAQQLPSRLDLQEASPPPPPHTHTHTHTPPPPPHHTPTPPPPHPTTPPPHHTTPHHTTPHEILHPAHPPAAPHSSAPL